jgi:hypothetical protein
MEIKYIMLGMFGNYNLKLGVFNTIIKVREKLKLNIMNMKEQRNIFSNSNN